MKYFNVIPILAGVLIFCISMPSVSLAQWSIGASYEIRNEEPTNGFGVRAEREFLQQLPLVRLNVRGHFSYFAEDNYAGEDGVTYGEINNYDFGLAAAAGVSVGLLTPYVGTGFGSTSTDLKGSPNPSTGDLSETSLFWNGFVGAELSPIPALRPFVEYRFEAAEGFSELRSAATRSNERLIFGLSLSF